MLSSPYLLLKGVVCVFVCGWGGGRPGGAGGRGSALTGRLAAHCQWQPEGLPLKALPVHMPVAPVTLAVALLTRNPLPSAVKFKFKLSLNLNDLNLKYTTQARPGSLSLRAVCWSSQLEESAIIHIKPARSQVQVHGGSAKALQLQ